MYTTGRLTVSCPVCSLSSACRACPGQGKSCLTLPSLLTFQFLFFPSFLQASLSTFYFTILRFYVFSLSTIFRPSLRTSSSDLFVGRFVWMCVCELFVCMHTEARGELLCSTLPHFPRKDLSLNLGLSWGPAIPSSPLTSSLSGAAVISTGFLYEC